MKIVQSVLLCSTLSVAAIAQQTANPPSNPPAAQTQTAADKALSESVAKDPNTRKAKDLLEKMVASLGGQAYLNYQTMTAEGRTYSFYQGRPSSAGAPFWRFWKFPDKERVELTKQRDVIYIYTGDKGYEVTYKGTAAMDAKDLSDYLLRRKYSMDNIVREWMKAPGTLVLYVGTGLADQQLVEQVQLITANNDAVTIGIDPNTGLPLKKSYTYRDYDGLKSTDDEVYANYRSIQGIQTPLSVVRFHNGLQAGQRFLTNVQYNVPLDDGKFDAKVSYDPFKLPKKH